jgi:hypothetical protein
MAEKTAKILLQIDLDADSLIKNIAKADDTIGHLTKSLDQARGDLKKLQESGKGTGAEFDKAKEQIARYEVALKTAKQEKAQFVKQAQNLDKANRDNGDSLNAMKAQLSLLTAEYNSLTQEQRENSDQGKALQASIKGLTDDLKGNESAIGNNFRNVGNYKEALRDLELQLQRMEVGTAEFQKTAAEAGELRDKINDAKEATRTYASGSDLTIIKNSFSGVGNSLRDLDFGEALEKSQALANISKNITFGNAVDGLKNFGLTLANVGKALLTNPLFILVGTIAATVGAINALTESFKVGEQAAKDNAEALLEVAQATKTLENANRDLQTQIDVAQGKITEQEGAKINAVNKFKDEYKATLKEQADALKKFNDDINKEKEDDPFKLSKSALEAAGFETEVERKRKAGILEINNQYNKLLEEQRKNLRLTLTEQQVQQLNEEAANEKAAQDKRKEIKQQDAENYKTALEGLLAIQLKFSEQARDIINKDGETQLETQKRKDLEEIEQAFNQTDKKAAAIEARGQAIAAINAKYDQLEKLEGDEALKRAKEIGDQITAEAKANEEERLANQQAANEYINSITQTELEQRLQRINEQEQQVLSITTLTEDERTRVKEAATQARAELEEEELKRGVQATAQAFGALGALYKKDSAEYKTFATAQALMNTYLGVTTALTDKTIPNTFVRIATAATVLIQGLAAVAQISKGSFYEGGYTGDGNPTEESTAAGPRPYTYHKREYIIPARVLEMPNINRFVTGVVEPLRQRRYPTFNATSYASGGFADTAIAANQGPGFTEMKEFVKDVIAAQPPTIVLVEDIDSGQSRRATVEGRANH